jgi:hypothetical protein
MNEAPETESGIGDPGSLTDVRTREEALSRTWEMELLISGGLVFSLFQLSSALDEGFRRMEPHLSLELVPGAAIGYQIAKVILRGMLAYIPTAGLARGEHLPRVEAVPGRRAKTPPKPHLIRFWT